MVTKVKLRANKSYKLILFAETEPGKFGTVITTNDDTTCECAASEMNVVAVSTAGGWRCSSWNMYVPDWGYTKEDDTHYIFNDSFSFSAYYTSYPSSRVNVSSGKVHIIDEHGTHIGTPTGDINVGKKCACGVKHESTDDGWTFLGWKVTLGGSSSSYGKLLSTGGTKTNNVTTFDAEYSEQYAIVLKAGSSSNDVTIEALYRSDTPVTKTVTLDANGGTVSPTTIQCTTGETYGVLPIPTRSGWRFIGWFDDQTGGNQIDGETQFTDTSPTTLYAHWDEVPIGTFVLTFDDAGGTGGPGSVEVSEGSSYTIPSTPPTRESYTFEYWMSGTDKYYPGDSITPTEDMTFVAIWSGGPYSPRPDMQKDFMVYSSGSGVLAYNPETGAIVYAV